ncbi:MAG: hypothetical protein KC457_22065, partial [Myxococcales bacterium]|nr:hypothetical protein [Myxococcales bacterium]
MNPRAQDQAQEQSVDEGPGLPAWGRQVPATVPEQELAWALAAELERAPLNARLQELLESERAGAGRARALWSLARIGGPVARDRLLAELDREAPLALAASALLEVPVFEAGSPPEPMPGDPWGQLEDALWTRLALSEPGRDDDGTTARALLLAIARLGGTRSIERLGVELADQPGPDHPAPVVARWSAAMEALGMMCARGMILDEGTVAALGQGLERDDLDAAHAALYALSRCARSSGEELAEGREELLRRLAPFITDRAAQEHPGHAMLAWRALAILGELPEPIPAAILSAAPPEWTVEVEAVRAMGSTAAGRTELRKRLAALSPQAFAGARQHVLLSGLHGMRSGIAADPRAADAELVGVGAMLSAARRSEDARLRRAAAMGLCELRLLQAIRSGEADGVHGCEQVAGAPTIDPLPVGWLAELEVEALLRATPTTGAEGRTKDNLGTAPIDEEAALFGENDEGAGGAAVDPARRARIMSLLAMARDTNPARATPALAALAEVDDPAVLPVLRAAL